MQKGIRVCLFLAAVMVLITLCEFAAEAVTVNTNSSCVDHPNCDGCLYRVQGTDNPNCISRQECIAITCDQFPLTLKICVSNSSTSASCSGTQGETGGCSGCTWWHCGCVATGVCTGGCRCTGAGGQSGTPGPGFIECP